MFIRTSNGYLLNLDKVKTIYACVETDNMCYVKAKLVGDAEIALYKDKESQYCLEYLSSLEDKIAIKII